MQTCKQTKVCLYKAYIGILFVIMCVKRFLKVVTFSKVERRHFSLAACLNKAFNQPQSANELPRPAGISSMFRLPVVSSTEGMFFFC